MRARIRDTELFFDVDGVALIAEGARMIERPTAFLIHGGPGSDHTGMKARYGGLTALMQLVYFDLRGHGRSSRGDPHRYTLDENVEDLEALRQHLGLASIVSVGTSYGGMVAMAHAARYPNSVSHLILIATAAHAGAVARAIELVSERGTYVQADLCKKIFSGSINTIAELRQYYELMTPIYARRSDPALSKASLERAILSPEALVRAHGTGGYMRTLDLRPELGTITAKTLVLAGRHDCVCAPEFSQEIHSLIRGSDIRIFEDSAHAIAGDEPQRFFDTIRGFFERNNLCQ